MSDSDRQQAQKIKQMLIDDFGQTHSWQINYCANCGHSEVWHLLGGKCLDPGCSCKMFVKGH